MAASLAAGLPSVVDGSPSQDDDGRSSGKVFVAVVCFFSNFYTFGEQYIFVRVAVAAGEWVNNFAKEMDLGIFALD